MNATPAKAPAPKGPAGRPGFGQLRCRDCGNPAGALQGFGFCRVCGAPMCFYCASNHIKIHQHSRTIIIPLFVVTIRRTTRIYPKVSICRSCRYAIEHARSRVLPESIVGSVMVFLAIALPLIGGLRAEAIPAIIFIAAFFAMLSFIPIYFTLRHFDEKKTRPTCPVCGRDAVGMLFRTRSELDIPFDQETSPDIIDCSCGYAGGRAPLDGLWVFVDQSGPEPLAGSPVERMAQASAYERQDVR